jgi:predicted metal-dependent phosphoesterase TrpH
MDIWDSIIDWAGNSDNWGTIADTAIKAGTAVSNNQNTQEAAQQAQQATAADKANIAGITQPSIQDLAVQLQEYVSAGQFTPQQAVTILQQESANQGYKIDPAVLAAQYQTLSQLQQVGQGGYTPAMAAGINQAITEGNTAARGQREALMASANARGVGGSGLDIVSQQMANQNNANQAHQQGLDIAEAAQQAALQALAAGGTQANAMRGQQTDEQTKTAAAQDAIARFNTQAKQSTADTNIANANAAQAANLASAQGIANANTDVANKNAANQSGAAQSRFNNALNVARSSQAATAPMINASANQAATDNAVNTDYAKIASGLANTYTAGTKKKSNADLANEQNDAWAAFASKGGQLPGAFTKAPQSDKLSDEEVDDLLDMLIPRKRFA